MNSNQYQLQYHHYPTSPYYHLKITILSRNECTKQRKSFICFPSIHHRNYFPTLHKNLNRSKFLSQNEQTQQLANKISLQITKNHKSFNTIFKIHTPRHKNSLKFAYKNARNALQHDNYPYHSTGIRPNTHTQHPHNSYINYCFKSSFTPKSVVGHFFPR